VESSTSRTLATDRHDLHDDTEAFYLRIAGPGDYRYKGADLGILITRGRLQSDDARSHQGAVRLHAQWTPVTPSPTPSTKSM
jgi:hypothetical protein